MHRPLSRSCAVVVWEVLDDSMDVREQERLGCGNGLATTHSIMPSSHSLLRENNNRGAT